MGEQPRPLAAHPACLGDGVCTNPNCPRHGVEWTSSPDRQPSDAAVEAAKSALRDNLWVTRHFWVDEFDCEVSEDSPEAVNREMSTYQDWSVGARAALEAAYRVDAPRPLLHQGDVFAALDECYTSGAMGGEWSTLGTDAVMELAQPMPTREQIAEALGRHYPKTGMVVASGVTCECGYWNGVESPGNDRPAGAQGRDGLNWHRAQVVLALLNPPA